MFSYAEGEPLNNNLQLDLAKKFGALIAELHVVSNRFSSPYSRPRFDYPYLLEEPIMELRQLVTITGSDNISFFDSYQKEMMCQLEELTINDSTFGIIHGDLNPSNIHYSNEYGFSIFDFDHCAYGWRIHDLAVIKLCFDKTIYQSVLMGYQEVRPLLSVELSKIDPYCNILLIRKYKDILDMLKITHKKDEYEKLRNQIVQNAVSTLKQMVLF